MSSGGDKQQLGRDARGDSRLTWPGRAVWGGVGEGEGEVEEQRDEDKLPQTSPPAACLLACLRWLLLMLKKNTLSLSQSPRCASWQY
jgi:hypothetical protein